MSKPTVAQPVVIDELQARFAVVQRLARVEGHEWEAIDAAATAGERPAAAGAARRCGSFDWMALPYRRRVLAALDQVAKGAMPWRGECESAQGSGLPAWLDLHITLLPGERTSACCLLTALDATDRKRNERHHAELRKLWTIASAASGMGTVIFDRGPRVVHLDERAARHHGLDASQLGQLPLDLWVGLLAEPDRLKAHALLTSDPSPGQTDALTVRIPSVDRKLQRVLELAFQCTADRDRLIGSCRDVTQERNVEEMRRKKLAAERASKAKSEFMSQVSHELRTPLNGILGFAQVALMDQEQPLPSEQYKRLEMVLYSGRRLLTLIDQLLEISKIEQGRRAMTIRSVNVASIVRLSIEQVNHLAGRAGITVVTSIERPEKAAMRADPGGLEQVMVNLLSNAIKYNRPGGRVRVRFEIAETAILHVEDTGQGMSESELGRLFEPFNRLSAQGTGVQGHGLGLVISRRLVEAMGGELRVMSKVGTGSIFSVHLPLASQSRFDASETLPLDLPSQWDAARQFDVLYIEDDEVNALLMDQVFLTQPAWRLRIAANGADGIRMSMERPPDVILLDLNLPDMSGQEVFNALRGRQSTARVPIVAVSADAMPTQIRRALAVGFADYWVKPLELTSVIGKLKALFA